MSVTPIDPRAISGVNADEALQLQDLIQQAKRTGNKKAEGRYFEQYLEIVSRSGFADDLGGFQAALAARQVFR